MLKPGHDLTRFDCGRDQITTWLRNRALRAGESDIARTFVVCRGSKRVVGFYALAAGAVAHASVSAALRQNAPDPVPVIILARLGVHREEQGRGLGQHLLGDAMRRALQAAKIIGARVLLIRALDADAAKFYEALNLKRLKAGEDMTFFLTMRELRGALG